jgi:hypothetical protein
MVMPITTNTDTSRISASCRRRPPVERATGDQQQEHRLAQHLER